MHPQSNSAWPVHWDIIRGPELPNALPVPADIMETVLKLQVVLLVHQVTFGFLLCHFQFLHFCFHISFKTKNKLTCIQEHTTLSKPLILFRLVKIVLRVTIPILLVQKVAQHVLLVTFRITPEEFLVIHVKPVHLGELLHQLRVKNVLKELIQEVQVWLKLLLFARM